MQTRNPHAVQPHLRKCFDAISKLQFGTKVLDETSEEAFADTDSPKELKIIQTNDIIAMISPEGETVDLGKGLKARGNVEDWLGKVEEAMFTQLRRKMKQAIKDFNDQPREVWLQTHANQVSQRFFSRMIQKISLYFFFIDCIDGVADYVGTRSP